MADIFANTVIATSDDSSGIKAILPSEQPLPSNVIMLRTGSRTIPVHLAEQSDRIESMHVDLFERIADDQVDRILSAINAAGFDTSHDQPRGLRIENDVMLVYEAIVALLARTIGYNHFLHEHSDKFAADRGEGDDSSDDDEEY